MGYREAMNDKATKPETDDDSDRDDAIVAADATGMIANERLISDADIEEGLEGGKS
jgi:hypothetical protein